MPTISVNKYGSNAIIMHLSNTLLFFSTNAYYVRISSSTLTINDSVHINHIRDVAGVDHVGLGAGFDGVNL